MAHSISTGSGQGLDTAADKVEERTEVKAVRVDAAGLLRLSPEQRLAIERLTAGETAAAAAAAAGVTRRTVTRWMAEDPEFQAAYNAWQADIIATVQAKLVAATDVAVAAVVAGMARGDTKTALALLTRMGMVKPPKPGPDNPEHVAVKQRAAREREMMRMALDQEGDLLGRDLG